MDKILKPAISIIVPCYNHAEFLPETLNSVLIQTAANWECIIINDGSTDNTEAVAKEWIAKDERFKYIHQQNGGLSAARNTGIESARGEYILPLDADDLIGAEYIAKALKAYEINKNLRLVYCQANKFGSENGHWQLPPYSYQYLLMDNCIFCSAIYRKSVWEEIGGYNIDFKQGYEDWEFWVRLLDIQSEVYQIPDILFHYRIKQVSRNNSIRVDDIELYRELIYNAKIENYRKHFGSYLKILYENYLLKDQVERMQNSNSYRIGNILLKPLAFLKSILKSK
ncbi:glycosyltransferase family A protein [Mucilaginibacter sp. L196]|uniref:glycosyltransferase family 2 protein n=1 Tax=Mucilaginibacter sp. L196 TaxID=1641870 RepID=UPI00131A7A3D|nr:glycosyltransferase family A protein [Mucilaginibacter sp. L196]